MRIVRQSVKFLRCYQLSSVRCHHLDHLPKRCSLRGSTTSTISIKSSCSSYVSNQQENSGLYRMYPEGLGVINYLKRLVRKSREESIESKQILQDTTFKEVLKELTLNVEGPDPNYSYEFDHLCSIYLSLLKLGLDSEHETMKILVKLIASQLDQATGWNLRSLMTMGHLMSQNELGKELINEVTSRMEQYLPQMSLEDLIGFLNPSLPVSNLAPSFIEKFSQTLTQMVEAADHTENAGLYLKLLVNLASHKMRPLPLLHAISDALIECNLNDYPDPLHLINGICALNTLNYADVRVLGKFEAALTSNDNLKVVKMSAISALLVSAGRMNWKCESILDSIAASIRDRSSPLRHQELISFVLLAARLNYKHDSLPQIINERILPEIDQTTVPDVFIWFDLIWSLVILDLAPVQQIESIFNPEFIGKLKVDKSPEALFSKWKLMNIRHYARTKGIKIDESIDLSVFQHPIRSVDSQALGTFASGILTSFIVRQKDLVTDFESPIGCIVDAEFIANKDFKILPIKEYGTHAEPLKDIPEGFKRVTMISYGFKDFILNDSKLIGPRQFVIDALKQIGSSPLVIKSSDINKDMKPVDRVKALRNKISEVLS